MGKLYEELEPKLVEWIERQRLFFVGTAPLDSGGHVNVSPKGPIETLVVLDERRIAYLDHAGSGAETIAHLNENGRVVVMLCAFDGPPRIVRLHGRGTVHQLSTPEFDELYSRFDPGGRAPASRSVVVIEIDRIADSCGYGVPLMSYEGERPQQLDWIDRKLRAGPNAIAEYMKEKNAYSLDGLAAFDPELLPDR